jgi:23S rRNA (cytosine1962-C5)-methyltransferase
MKNNSIMEYKLLDTGNFRKLEQVGAWKLIRPALCACWQPKLNNKEWQSADAEFVRDSSGHGKWKILNRPLPESWQMRWGNFNLHIKPTSFGHLGFFAEQYRNWERFRKGGYKNGLNLFGYSGIGSMAMAAGGAKVCHLDAARGMNEWGQENMLLNPEVPNAIRWITDDVKKFVNREVRRGSRYDLIALDPPSFGRGSSGQVWKIETDLPRLLECCRELRDPDRPFNLVLSCHSPGFSLEVFSRMVKDIFGSCRVEGEEMTIPESTGKVLPAGISCWCILDR